MRRAVAEPKNATKSDTHTANQTTQSFPKHKNNGVPTHTGADTHTHTNTQTHA
jgi:hypothetical protein